jgi:uncharacterized hydrophobic protein (TIGR00271 family)
MLFVRVFVSAPEADQLLPLLHEIDGIHHIARIPMEVPATQMITMDVRPECADRAIAVIDRLDIPETDVLISRMSLVAPVGRRRNTRLTLGNDGVVWADLLGEARVHARAVVRYLIFMAIAGIIAGFGVIGNDTILIVGAMALSPDLLPVSAACVGIISGRHRLAARATLTLVIGLALATAAALIITRVLDFSDRLPAAMTGGTAGLGSHPTVGIETVVVAFVAGIAGMLAFETRAGQAVGVAISVTTIPAAAYAGVAFAMGAYGYAESAIWVLATNVLCLLVGGTITLAVQRMVRPLVDTPG